jgi:RimJ/RimL family protein N-acetyltransferase
MIIFNNREHGERIARRIPRNYNPAVDPVISHVDKDGKLLGGVIFDGYTGSCVFAHQASFDKRWLSRDMLWVLFDYPFNQLKVKKICGTIPSSNPKLLEFNLKLGFIVETIIKDGYPDGDMLVMSMTRGECRWLDMKPRGLRGNS